MMSGNISQGMVEEVRVLVLYLYQPCSLYFVGGVVSGNKTQLPMLTQSAYVEYGKKNSSK